MTTKDRSASELIALVASVAPMIAIQTIWERDEDARWDIEDDTLDADDFTAWQSEVRATVIVAGRMVHGSAYMGGTWEKFGDAPSKSNPDIGGYFPQMLVEALRELRTNQSDSKTDCDILAAINAL